MKEEARHLSAAGAEADNQLTQNNRLSFSAQHPKPHVCRAIAPSLPCCGGDTITTFFNLVALHLRRTIPAVSDLTLDDFDVALTDLRPQLRELIEYEIREARLDDEEE